MRRDEAAGAASGEAADWLAEKSSHGGLAARRGGGAAEEAEDGEDASAAQGGPGGPRRNSGAAEMSLAKSSLFDYRASTTIMTLDARRVRHQAD